MKKREKIMGINERSPKRIGREELWYFSEDKTDRFNLDPEITDREKPDLYSPIIREENDRLAPKIIGKNRYKRECAFVVDWQLSDSL